MPHPALVMIVLVLELVAPKKDYRVMTCTSVDHAKFTLADYNQNAKSGTHWEGKIYFVDMTEQSIEERIER